MLTGSRNVLLGNYAAFNNSSGEQNALIGNLSGYNSVGSNNVFLGYMSGYSETESNKLYIENTSSSLPLIYGDFNSDFVTINGKLGIGTTEFGDAQLAVNGKIVAKEIVITVDNFPDYVFDDDYALLPLNDLETYVKTNKHLPGIKSRVEVLDQGVDLGELNTQLLEKIEELTLHVINLDKKASEISDMNEEMQKEIEGFFE